MNYKRIILIILTIVCLATIFCFSNQTSKDSNGLSDKIIIKTYEFIHRTELNKSDQKKIIKKYNYVVRKTAHVFIYMVLGSVLICLLYSFRIKRKLLIIISILLCFIYAASDEFHQSFLDRTASVLDVFIDTAGASLGIIMAYFLVLRKRFIKK